MKRIIFENPPKDLFYSLKEIGLVVFYDQKDESTHTLKGIPLFKLKTEFSENACLGNFDDIKLSGSDYLLKFYDEENHAWKSASIDLTDAGIKILKSKRMESSIDKTEKCCANCEGYNGECNNPESFQYGDMTSLDYECVHHEFKPE